jgi:hypothetical protein
LTAVRSVFEFGQTAVFTLSGLMLKVSLDNAKLRFGDEPAQPDDKEKLRRNRPTIANS